MAVYFVNWQRDVSVQERAGKKVVVKRSKPNRGFHEYILLCTYVLMSVFLGHPSAPPKAGDIARNEGSATRDTLARLGVPTPALVSMSQDELVEEYIESGDLYRALASGSQAFLAGSAGRLTALLHNAGLVFTDNKAQNFLVRNSSLLRTDLAFMQENKSTFARSMDIGSFLASVMDLPDYAEIEREFYNGYSEQTGRRFPYLSLVIRNILSFGFSSDGKTALKNMLLNSSRLVG